MKIKEEAKNVKEEKQTGDESIDHEEEQNNNE